ncbi:hypothetical protein C8R47DRAFT_1074739 [Mycena vitilis]|nr:hypothetical protein C8R47DRAFT_1074739 [Mycena vitilis]
MKVSGGWEGEEGSGGKVSKCVEKKERGIEWNNAESRDEEKARERQARGSEKRSKSRSRPWSKLMVEVEDSVEEGHKDGTGEGMVVKCNEGESMETARQHPVQQGKLNEVEVEFPARGKSKNLERNCIPMGRVGPGVTGPQETLKVVRCRSPDAQK